VWLDEAGQWTQLLIDGPASRSSDAAWKRRWLLLRTVRTSAT